MERDKPTQPRTAADVRRTREAEALRANLLKRKLRQRARDTLALDDGGEAGPDEPERA